MDELLKLLKSDAHAPVRDLARELNLAEADVTARIAKLESGRRDPRLPGHRRSAESRRRRRHRGRSR